MAQCYRGWMVYDRAEAARNREYIRLYQEASRRSFPRLALEVALIEELTFGVRQGRLGVWRQGQRVPLPDFAVCRMRYPLLTGQLELCGVRCFNPLQVAQTCNDKARTYQLAAQAGIPTVDTLFFKNKYRACAGDAAREITRFPAVFKTSGGHGGLNVHLARGPQDIPGILEQMGHWDFVVQPYVGESARDLRVYVVGKQIAAAVLRSSREDFRANFGLGGQVEEYRLNGEEERLVRSILGWMDFGLAGIDFLFEGDRLVFNEIEDVVGSRMLYHCSQVDIVPLYLEHILKTMDAERSHRQ